jgi:hypothetical protein
VAAGVFEGRVAGGRDLAGRRRRGGKYVTCVAGVRCMKQNGNGGQPPVKRWPAGMIYLGPFVAMASVSIFCRGRVVNIGTPLERNMLRKFSCLHNRQCIKACSRVFSALDVLVSLLSELYDEKSIYR